MLHKVIMGGSRGGGGQGVQTPPPEKSQKSRVSYQYWSRSPENNHKASKPAFECWAIIGPPAKRHLPASETPFKWRFACGPIMADLLWYLDPLSPHQLKKTNLDPL